MIERNKDRKKDRNKKKILLSEGIVLSDGFYEQREMRWADLAVRTVTLFAIVAGAFGGMLSAFGISYTGWAFFLAVFAASLYCASLYFSSWWENLGYILLFFFMIGITYELRTYINSGFYGIVNDISSIAMEYFDSNALVNYTEQVADHFLAVSVAVCYLGFLGCVFINALISRRMRCIPAAVPAVLCLLLSVYLEREPSGGYVVLLATGLVTVYALRQNDYSGQERRVKVYQRAARKHLFFGSYSGQAAGGLLVISLLLCSAVTGLVGLLFPGGRCLSGGRRLLGGGESAFKLRTMDTMENFYLLGISGLLNLYPNTGGLVNGRLGGVSAVRLDYETDLTLEFVPYTYDRIYLRTFIGEEYVPYENRWKAPGETYREESWSIDTAERLETAFMSGEDGYARGSMKIKNVAAAAGVYLPYYSMDTARVVSPGREQEYTYYPLLAESLEGSAEHFENMEWLFVPFGNRESIDAVCEEAGLSGTPDEIVEQLRGFFQEEFPYTLRPGLVPRGKDFVNYFLTEKRKGYCAYYASAAVLILRNMHIPARYVEGYAVDAGELAENGTLTGGNVSDYYEGTSLLPQSAVMSFGITDANAHAWVEIYDKNLGWRAVELTPYSLEEDNQGSMGIWSLFLTLFQTGANSRESGSGAEEGEGGGVREAMPEWETAAFWGILLLLGPAYLLARMGGQLWRYSRADRNEKLLICYRRKVRKVCRKEKRHGKYRKEYGKSFREQKSFEAQAAWLVENGFLNMEEKDIRRLVRILNRAAFSGKSISEEEFRFAMEKLNTL